MTKTALDEKISAYVAYHRYYQRLIAVKIVSEGNTIADAANILGKSYQTVHRWIKTCESEGLKPSFGGGRPLKLTYDHLNYIKSLKKHQICQWKMYIFLLMKNLM